MLKSTTVFQAFYAVQKHVLEYGLHPLPPRYRGIVHQASSVQSDTPGGVGSCKTIRRLALKARAIPTNQRTYGRETGKTKERTLSFAPWNCLKREGNELQPYLDDGNRDVSWQLSPKKKKIRLIFPHVPSVSQKKKKERNVSRSLQASPYRIGRAVRSPCCSLHSAFPTSLTSL